MRQRSMACLGVGGEAKGAGLQPIAWWLQMPLHAPGHHFEPAGPCHPAQPPRPVLYLGSCPLSWTPACRPCLLLHPGPLRPPFLGFSIPSSWP